MDILEQTSRKLKFVHIIKMMEEQINQTIDQLVFFLMFQKYMKDTFIVNYTITLIRIFFQNTNVVLVKALVLSIPSIHGRKNENCSR